MKKHLTEFDVFTVRELGMGGVKNGKLMEFCVDNEFDILLTTDKNLMFQQNLDKYPLTIVVLDSFSSKIEKLSVFIPTFKLQLPELQKNQVYIIKQP